MIRRALARREVLIISINSIRLSLMLGGQVDWTINRSLPRMSSLMSTTTSPSAKRPIYSYSSSINRIHDKNRAECPNLSQSLLQEDDWHFQRIHADYSSECLYKLGFIDDSSTSLNLSFISRLCHKQTQNK